MTTQKLAPPRPLVAALLAAILAPVALAQTVTDLEPNNSCAGAQAVASATDPVTVAGSLDSDGALFDIDFFRFSRPAGVLAQIDLEGASTGQGSLGDPLVGLFDSQCNLIGLDDDSGLAVNSRLQFVVPADGEFVVAATAYPDFSFVGGGVGSYVLRLDRVRQIDYIAGRLVDSNSGQSLPGFEFPFASASLYACDANGCGHFVSYLQAGPDGEFRFDAVSVGIGLSAGTYQLRANAIGYFESVTAEFDVEQDEGVELGDIPMEPLTFIGSISGRAVDAVDGTGLAGLAPPFAFVEVQRCEDFGCFGLFWLQTDFDGSFAVDGVLYQLIPGDYRVVVRAEDYLPTESALVSVGGSEHVDFGDVAVEPLPIRVDVVTPCVISPRGLCQFDVVLRNRSGGHYSGVIWSVVEYFGATSPPVFTRFQVGARGVADPAPRRFALAAGEERSFRFALWVPRSVPPGSTLCANVAVGELPGGVFAPVSDRFAFCTSREANAAAVTDGPKGRALREALRKRHGVPD